MKIATVAYFLLFCGISRAAASANAPDQRAQFPAPQFLSFDDLTVLSRTAEPQGALGERLQQLLTSPFVRNDAEASGIPPHRPSTAGLGPIIRAGFWNIERGLNFNLIESALAGTARSSTGNPSQAVEAQLRRLQDTDILLLNEVDLGMKRTEYRDVTRDLAAALHMNYAYAVEFVEVDPLSDLGIEKIDLPDKSVENRVEEDLKVDPDRYRGLHGNAALSRYPIRRARILRLPVCYDWYSQETQAIAKIETGKRWTARKLFRERIEREVRHGGRIALIVDLTVPNVPGGELTVVSVHLENKCPPGCRQRQMNALLGTLRDVRNPLVMAGDLNTSGSDATPTSVRNEIMKRVTDYRFWVTHAVFWYTPIPQYALAPLRYFHRYLDPTALHLPFLWENRERGLFKQVEKFRFADDYAFDFRGRTERTLDQKQRTLANSNQRGRKGFVPTYSFERDFGGWVGRFKLDWFFVKPLIHDPRRDGQSYRLAPHFPVTMREVNESAPDRISDHPPMTVDLPLTEPALASKSNH